MSSRPTQLIVRNLEPAVVDRLKRRARANGRSLEAELRLVLERYARWGTVTEASPPYVVEPSAPREQQTVRWPRRPVKFEPFQPVPSKGKPASEIVAEDRR